MHNIQGIRIKYKFANYKYTEAVPQARRSVASSLPRRPSFDPSSGDVGFVMDRMELVHLPPEYLSLCSHFSFHRLSIFINHERLVQQPINDRSSSWTQFHSLRRNKKGIK
jgi:hypothetical protein